MNNEELGYVSSSPYLATEPVKIVKNEEDLSALKAVLSLLDDRMKYYRAIDSLHTLDNSLSVEQRLAVSTAIVGHISELRSLITNAIEGVENGR